MQPISRDKILLLATQEPRTFLHYKFNPHKAKKAVTFIERYCVLFEGQFAGKPIQLRPWQKRLIEELFGWEDPATGLRRYRKAFWFFPKKNGKSTLIAGIALYMLIADGEAGGQVILASNSREQSMNVFRPAAGMVEQSPALQEECQIVASSKRILHPETKSFLAVIPAEAKTIQGLSISCLIYDEIADAPNRDLYDKLTTASKARIQPLQLFITTAGKDFEGIGHELYRYAKSVLADPKSDPTFYPCLFELDKTEDWQDEANWFKVNPALGDFNQLADMRAEYREALSSTSAANKFKMYSLNQWIQAADSWLDADKWKQCYDPTFDESTLTQYPCFLSIDFAKITDLTAVSALWALGDRRYYLKTYFFIPEVGLRERVLRDHVPYDSWIEQNWVTTCPGTELDYAFPKQLITDLSSKYHVKNISYDLWGARQFVQELEKEGIAPVTMVRFGHLTLAEPSKEFESLILGGRIKHDNSPCMNWQIGNVAPRLDQNANIVPDKQRSSGRIDGVCSTIIALYAALKTPDEVKKPTELRVTLFG